MDPVCVKGPDTPTSDLREWIDAYGPQLRAHLTRICGSEDDAEDVLQLVWLRAHEAPPTGAPNRNVRAWLYRVATHAALDRLRVERRRARLLAERITEREPNAPEDLDWLGDAGRARVRECCMRLPRKQRDAVWHRWIEQKDYETVAERLGVTVETARANVYHGLKRLRRELEDLWSQENE